MTIVADLYDLIIGVDTHAASHTLAVVTGGPGAVLAKATFPTTPAGLSRAVGWVRRRTADRSVLLVVEGIGSYGAMLTGRLHAAGFLVAEAPTIPSVLRRGKGKTDQVDAVLIARATAGLTTGELRWPRTEDGTRVALEVLLGARDQMNNERTRHINTLTALVRTRDLGVDARRRLTTTQITTIAAWRSREEEPWVAVCRREAVRLATRIRALDAELAANYRDLTQLTTVQAPELLALPGVGPVVAAAVLIAWSHPGRVRSEAAFAALAGTCPIPASSGNTTRHRLNRGGDRQLNRALHTVVLTRMRYDPTTRAYVTRRTADGKTSREIRRILKRYATRQLYRTLTAAHPATALPAQPAAPAAA